MSCWVEEGPMRLHPPGDYGSNGGWGRGVCVCSGAVTAPVNNLLPTPGTSAVHTQEEDMKGGGGGGRVREEGI